MKVIIYENPCNHEGSIVDSFSQWLKFYNVETKVLKSISEINRIENPEEYYAIILHAEEGNLAQKRFREFIPHARQIAYSGAASSQREYERNKRSIGAAVREELISRGYDEVISGLLDDQLENALNLPSN